MKKILIVCISLLLLSLCGCKSNALPKPELDSGQRGELGVDKNINETTIDNYLNRDDAVYRDMRMLEDVADYEAIGGDSHISGFIKGFEVVPFPYICNPDDMPEEIGEGYKGNALFTHENDTYIANYKESLSIVEQLFPRDKVIFLMCGAGGYAGMMKNLLIYLGYDQDKLYDIGGYWYYEGENDVNIKFEENGETVYKYELLTYHDIPFDELNPVEGYTPKDDNGEEIKEETIHSKSLNVIDILSVEEFDELIKSKETFLLYVYLPGCVSCSSFSPIVKEFIKANDITMYELNYQILKGIDNNIIKESISWTPSIFIFIDGKVEAFLNPRNEDDKEIYETTENLSNWINKYIDVEIVKTNSHNDNKECNESTCKL